MSCILIFAFQGKNIEFIQQDDNNRRWFNEFRSKSVSTPIGLETIDRKSLLLTNKVKFIETFLQKSRIVNSVIKIFSFLCIAVNLVKFKKKKRIQVPQMNYG